MIIQNRLYFIIIPDFKIIFITYFFFNQEINIMHKELL